MSGDQAGEAVDVCERGHSTIVWQLNACGSLLQSSVSFNITASDVSCLFFFSYQMQDWDGKLLAEANAKKHTLPSFFPITYRYPVLHDWDTVSKVC